MVDMMVIKCARFGRCKRGIVFVAAGIGLDGFRIDGGQFAGCLSQNVAFLVGTDSLFVPLSLEFPLPFALQLTFPLLRLLQVDVD